MPNDTLDLNVNNYDTKDLLDILDLNTSSNINDTLKSISKEDVIDSTQYYIDKFTTENKIDMMNFFMEIRDSLLDVISEYNSTNNADSAADNVADNVADNAQDNPDAAVKEYDDTEEQPGNRDTSNLIVNRYAPIQNQLSSGTNSNAVIKQDTIQVTNTFSPAEVKGNINPLLKNTYSCFINIDSKYRQYTGNNSETQFTLDLSEHIKKLLSLQLYSYQIPYSWYNINKGTGNTCFWIEDPPTNNRINISIEPGNYDATSLTAELNSVILTAGFSDFPTTPFVYNSKKGKIVFNLYGGIYKQNGVDVFTITESSNILFFEPFFTLDCNPQNCGVKIPSHIHKTLGWILGFRSPFVQVDPSGNYPAALLDLNGPRYLILKIDDFKKNHINNNIIAITQYDNTLKLPTYYKKDSRNSCIDAFDNYQSLIDNIDINNDINAVNTIADNLHITHSKTPYVVPTIPRTLTQSQIYTINQILKNNKKNTNIYSSAPTNNDVFAIIPIKKASFGDIITEFSGSIQSNERIYFGAVDVTRMQISLYDDAGNLIDLNGVHWTFTMIAKCLYQF